MPKPQRTPPNDPAEIGLTRLRRDIHEYAKHLENTAAVANRDGRKITARHYQRVALDLRRILGTPYPRPTANK